MLVNIGCGGVFHPAWNNLDMHPSVPAVRSWDLRQGLPFGDGAAQACFASHVLEHLHRDQARALLRECFRVLEPHGIIRLVVPDLEAIAGHYLRLLEMAERAEPGAQEDYEWITLELLDQLVRDRPGGEMAQYLARPRLPNEAFVRSRVGMELDAVNALPPRRLGQRIRKAAGLLACSMLFGRPGRSALREGLFRQEGEVHRWMYDRYSLRLELTRAGFEAVRCCAAGESEIERFADYSLELRGGSVRKPDSLFMEARKP